MAPSYSNECVCGKKYDNNCAHFLSNWMILNSYMESKPDECVCCDSSRPIRAKEILHNVFKDKTRYAFVYRPDKNENYFIYCENESNHRGHVYYGKKDECFAGTGSATNFVGYDKIVWHYKPNFMV